MQSVTEGIFYVGCIYNKDNSSDENRKLCYDFALLNVIKTVSVYCSHYHLTITVIEQSDLYFPTTK